MVSNRLVWVTVSVLLCATITACGGGGSSGGGNSGDPGSSSSRPSDAFAADAGRDQRVKTGQQVRLNASASGNADTDSLKFQWQFKSRPKSSKAALDSDTRVKPAFRADVDGKYVLRLLVASGEVIGKPDEVTITSTGGSANSAPVADAGNDQNVVTGLAVKLDGSASSDADGDALAYAWKFVSMPEGSETALANESKQTPQFTPDVPGAYVIQLVVDDGRAKSAPNTVRIVAAERNSAPVADAGADRNINVGSTAKLDGSASSDANDDTLTYAWRVVSRPAESSAKLVGAEGNKPSLTADKLGDYLIGLTVNDGRIDSVEDRVTVSAGPLLALFVESGSGEFVPISQFSPPMIQVLPNAKNQRLSRLQLRAIGRDFTIVDLQTVAVQNEKPSDDINPFFGSELSDPTSVEAGKSVTFTTNVRSIPANGSYELGFRFKVKETGQPFTLSYTVEVQ